MEELQDAIEDAQYVNAITTQEDGPRPVVKWDIPTEEQLEEWKETKRNSSGTVSSSLSAPFLPQPTTSSSNLASHSSTATATANANANANATTAASPAVGSSFFELEPLLESAIGLFLFSAFLKDVCHDYLRINFVEEVQRWRKMRSSREKIDKAKKIITHYLKGPKKDASTGQPIVPDKTQINEYDLERLNTTRHIPHKEFKKMVQENFDSTNTKCYIGLDGPVRDEIFTKIHAVEEARSAYRKEREKEKQERQKLILLQQQQKETSQATQETTMTSASTNNEDGSPEEDNPTAANNNNDGTDNNYDNHNDTNNTHADEQKNEEMQETSDDHNNNNNNDNQNSNNSNRNGTKAAVPIDGSIASSSCNQKLSSSRLLTMTKRTQQSVGPRFLPERYFDRAEAIVLEGLKVEYFDAFQQSEQYKKLMDFLWYQDRTVTQDDFVVMRVLGRGGFGLVTACKKGTSGKLYAMKVMNKRRIKMKKSEQLALNERAALSAVESPFVVNLKYSFQSKEDVFLILDLMTGGDLGYHLHIKHRFPKKECLYYAARIMLGLQAMHDKKYVYRDLKPENCLLANDGRVKLTDLGLATKITPTLHGAAGTRGYWAPEMLRRDKKGKRMPYGHTVDWFSFGCCLAEFISGQNPFRSERALNFGLERGKQTKEKAIDCATLEMEPEFNESFDPEAADLCRKLLDKNEKTRIGYNGCEEIMAHPWFKDISWEHIISDLKKPPFVPLKDVNAASQSEIGTFAEDKAYQETVIEEKDEKIYRNWDWTNPRAFSAEVIEFLIYERVTGEPLIPQPPHSSCCCVIS